MTRHDKSTHLYMRLFMCVTELPAYWPGASLLTTPTLQWRSVERRLMILLQTMSLVKSFFSRDSRFVSPDTLAAYRLVATFIIEGTI